MTVPRFSFVNVIDHELHVAEWGDPGNTPLVMWHGLARTGRDFDELAAALSDDYFVLCPDTIGRGLSSWSDNPEVEYSIEYYTCIAADLLDHYQIDRTCWIGTSMGGIIGMRMASGPLADRLSCLILNDVGPEVPKEAVDRILAYAGTLPDFATLSEAGRWLRTVYAPFGEACDEFWNRMARSSVRRRDDGRFTLHYDPKIMVQFTATPEALSSWDRLARITLPMHLIRGEGSDILPAGIAGQMQALMPGMKETVMTGCGHAPTLSRPEDARLVRGVLSELRDRAGGCLVR